MSMDGYIRVSRVGGRDDDSYLSPDEQREKIEGWCNLYGVELDEIVVEEDVSGVTALSQRELGRLIAKCEQHESEGIVVREVSRFGRSTIETLEAVDRLSKAGGRLVGVLDGVDSAHPSGELVITILAALAREQWKQRKANWAAATRRAVADGVHISAKAPRGYVRPGKRQPLVLSDDAKLVKTIHELFIMRAERASWQQLADHMTAKGYPIAKSSVTSLIKNPAYMGHARGTDDGKETPNAHPAIVTEDEFHAAQWTGVTHAKTGTTAAEALLGGLLTCAGCGRKLSVTRSTNHKGVREAVYFCKGRAASTNCPAPAAGRAKYIDAYVTDAIMVALGDGTLGTTLDAIDRHERAQAAVERAKRELDEVKTNAKLMAVYGVAGVAEMAVERKAALEEARRTLRETPKPDETLMPTVDTDAWTDAERRTYARQFIAEVTLTKGKRGTTPEPDKRVKIRWAGHDDFDATLNERIVAWDAWRERFVSADSAPSSARSAPRGSRRDRGRKRAASRPRESSTEGAPARSPARRASRASRPGRRR